MDVDDRLAAFLRIPSVSADPSRRDDVRQRRSRRAPDAEEIHADCVLPVVGIGPARNPAATDARVREHDVEPTETLCSLGDGQFHRSEIAHVGGQRKRLGATALGRGEDAGFVDVQKCDARSALRKKQRRLEPDSARRAGDES